MFQSRSIQSSLSFKDKLFSIDYVLVLSILILGIVSMFAMYSTDGGQFKYHTESHIVRFFVFFIMFFILSFIQIRFWHSTSYLIYFVFLILLVGVKYFGLTSSGSQRWLNFYFMNLQPSELMKVGLILFLAKYYHRIPIESVNRVKFLFLPIFVLIFPVLLVVMQPDLGTSILIAAGGLVVAWLAGVRVKFFAYSILIFVALLPIAISFLKPYQKARILTFLNPEKDPLGAGYQIIQSKIAIGSGGLFGKGFLNGSQSYLDYLPEKHTDFIFTLFSEEFGFFGSVFILLLYAIIVSRIVKIGNITRSNFGKLYCYSFATAFFIYVVVNMGMVLGLLPIVGSPLPILSYGGSSMMAMMFGLGIAMSCKVYKDSPVN
ncbi:MAG: rod shape-determining protein RodA [Candidatus Pelagibacter sp. TMED273]|nr:MAG: rod shape-determining protein RodA [Candidatus Pelagibacter sp. TMED273]|tara:strand:- start:1954 stop:3078 length:1125 start_codon:yes stop_codon:yes gene_type:complete